MALPPDHLRGALGRELVPSPKDRPNGHLGFEDVELWQLPEAGRFSSDPALANPVELIKEFRRQPASQLLSELVRGSDGEFFEWDGRKPGRPRDEGDWPSLYLGYVADGAVAIQKFHHKLPSTGLLEACGFDKVPSRQSIDGHFVALEARVEAFDEVAHELIGRARQVDPRVGVSVFVDGTAFHSASMLEHACDNADACARAGGVRGAQLRKATAEEVSEEHFRESDAEEAQLEMDIAAAGRTRGPVITLPSVRGPIQCRTMFIKGHRFLTRDLSSGVRWYDNPGRFWLGGYQLAAVDTYTGVPLSLSVFPADIMEWDGYPALFDGMVAALGTPPRIASVDRGFASKAFYEYNARRGLAVVAPFRKRHKGEQPEDRRTDAFDEHGVPRCKYCGGPGDQLSAGLGPVFGANGEPHIRFRCLVPRTHDCHTTQQLPCAADWVQLPLLPQEAALFHAARHVHHNKEGAFQYDRRRYAVSGKVGLGRLCRTGIEVHRLRCSAALLLNWFRLSLRHGWIEPVELPVTLNTADPVRLSTLYEGVGDDKLADLLNYRDAQNLDLPYGRAARRLRHAYQERA